MNHVVQRMLDRASLDLIFYRDFARVEDLLRQIFAAVSATDLTLGYDVAIELKYGRAGHGDPEHFRVFGTLYAKTGDASIDAQLPLHERNFGCFFREEIASLARLVPALKKAGILNIVLLQHSPARGD